MSHFFYPFRFEEDSSNIINGSVELQNPVTDHNIERPGDIYRTGRITTDKFRDLEIVLYHNHATARFMYLHKSNLDKNLLEIIGLDIPQKQTGVPMNLPGQLCLGADRSHVINDAIEHIIGSPAFEDTFKDKTQQNMAVFPIAREGLKYGVAEGIFHNYGYYCDEIVLDAHHVFDSSVPVYNRTVELTLFKDKDLDQQQKENITVAFLADSIASGLVMKEVVSRVSERFENLTHVEIVAPLATIRGLCRIAQSEAANHLHIRVHVFETLLNALPPDFYYSAHFKDPNFHIRPDLDLEYRKWWGKDANGNAIADTACAGYGWSEVFYSPRKQIQMMNNQLTARHGTTIAEIVGRNIP